MLKLEAQVGAKHAVFAPRSLHDVPGEIVSLLFSHPAAQYDPLAVNPRAVEKELAISTVAFQELDQRREHLRIEKIDFSWIDQRAVMSRNERGRQLYLI